MRCLRYLVVPLVLGTMVGCAGSGQSPATPPETTGSIPESQAQAQTTLGGVLASGDTAHQAVAIYTLHLDPATLDATLVPKEVRAGQANDDVTDLDVSCFLAGGSVKLVSVAKGVGTVDVTYAFTHPFAASAAAATLGAPVRVVVMTDSEPAAPTFFPGDGDVVVNTNLVANASGYLDPGALLDTTGFTATAFPYQVLVDETLDNRNGVSNGGDSQGNWDSLPGAGWQTGSQDSWTGFGWVHRGQTATRTLSLNTAALTGAASFDLAFLAKYTKPNSGGTTKAPQAPVNTLAFAYRTYHGALDLEAIAYTGESGGFMTNVPSPSTLEFHVRDWDAQAPETAQVDLKDEPDAAMVAIGESGEPTLELSIPGVLTGTHTLTEAADSGTGLAGDELVYSETVVKGPNGTIPGDYPGLIRATDPEATLDTSLWHFAIDCADFSQVATPAAITYQVFSVTMIPDNTPPTATVIRTSADPMNSGTQPAISITALADLEGDPIDVYIDWGDGNGFPGTPNLALPGPGYTPPYNIARTTLPTMNNADLTPDPFMIVVRIDDGGSPVDFPLSYTLGPNRAPVRTAGSPALASPSVPPGSSFTMNQGGVVIAPTPGFNLSDPEGDPITFKLTCDVAPNGPFPAAPAEGQALPIPNIGPYPVVATVNMTVYACDPLHTSTVAGPDQATAYPVILGSVSNSCLTYAGAPLLGYPQTCRTFPSLAGQTVGPIDFASWPSAMVGGLPTGPIFQSRQAATADIIMTRAGVLCPSPVLGATQLVGTGPSLFANQVYQVEADGTGRVIFAQRTSATFDSFGTPATVFADANTTFRYFDFTGAPVADTSFSSFNTTFPIVAMTVDTANRVYTIDTSQNIRRFSRSGPTYVADGAPFPISLAALFPVATWRLPGLVVEPVGNVIFVVAENNVAGVNDGRVLRVECDGSIPPVVPATANPNPMTISLTTSVWGFPCGIELDLRDTTGGVLGAPSGGQIMVTGFITPGTDLTVVNANLTVTGGTDWAGPGKCAFYTGSNAMLVKNGAGTGLGIYGSPPAGWQ